MTKQEFKQLYQSLSNKDLARKLSISIPTLISLAKKNGCEKKKMGARPKVILKD
jgi:hypothetical protein